MIRNFASLLAQVAIVFVTLWSIGACLGVVAVGYCMVAGC